MRPMRDFGSNTAMLDNFDRTLLDAVQRDDSRTADELAVAVPLSSSAIARRLRRLRGDGSIARTIALLSSRLVEHRLRALVLVQLGEHADRAGKAALLARLEQAEEVQFAYEISGSYDLLALLDCSSMDALVALAEQLFAADSTVRRYETSFVKRELKFAPFVRLSAR
jgi:Lrp/AsnC family leucine-responsive transcriptional regulator